MAYFKKIHEYLRNFIEISEEEFKYMLPYFEIRQFPKRKKLVDTGEVEDYFNIILKGLARKYIIAGKKEVTQQLATEGHVIHSEISFNKRIPSLVIIETIEPTIFFSVKFDHVELLFRQMPRLEKLGRLIVTDLFIRKDKHDFIYLNKTPRRRFLDYMATHPQMLQRVPQKYIASFLHIKPETFSRLKHLLKRKTN